MLTLFSLGIAQAIFLCLLIAGRGRKIEISQKILITWLLAIVANLIFYLVSFSGHIYAFDFLLFFWGAEIIHGPLLYLYTLSVIDRGFKLKWSHLLHGVAYILICGVLFYYHYFTDNTIEILNGYIIFKKGAPFILVSFSWLIKIAAIFYLTLSFWHIHNKRKSRELFFSDLEKVNLNWLANFLIGVFLGYLLLYGSTPNFFGLKDLTDYEMGVINTVVSVFFAFYAGYVNHRHQSDVIQYSSRPTDLAIYDLTKSPKRYRKTGLSAEKSLAIKNQLLELMAKKKPFLDSRLTLKELADELEVSTNHLSQVINEKMELNFFAFVNEYRIEEFKERIGQGDHYNYSLIGVALNCGFSSKSSFYTIFKKVTGITPAEYIQRMQSSAELRSAS